MNVDILQDSFPTQKQYPLRDDLLMIIFLQKFILFPVYLINEKNWKYLDAAYVLQFTTYVLIGSYFLFTNIPCMIMYI